MAAYQIFLIYLGVMSVVTLITFVIDKIKAINGAWRIPEAVLLGMSFLGGAVGGYIGMFVSNHKVRKWYFHAVEIFSIALHSAITVLVYLFV